MKTAALPHTKPRRIGTISMRVRLRAFQHARAAENISDLLLDLETLRHADLDLAIKSGALLTFNGLIIAVGINPIAASPGSPISVDAVTHPLIVAMTALGVILMAAAAAICVRAILVGEEFDDHGLEEPAEIMRRLYATYCAAIDAQGRLLATAGAFTYAGGAVTGAAFLWSLAEKWM